MKVTFKTEKPTGRFSWLSKPIHYAKINKKVFGTIGHEDFRIRLMVFKDDINEDENPNCDWKWITLSKKPTSVEDAKAFLQEKINPLNEKYKLRFSK